LLFKTRNIILAVLSLISVYACGYRFAGSGGFPHNVEKIFIEVFENRTTQTGVERTVTNQLVFEFTRQREASLAGSADEADAVLKGVIASIRTETISRIGTELANEREVVMTVEVKLVKNDGAIIWAAKGLQDREAFGVSDSKLETDRSQDLAIARLSERMSERIFNRLTDDF
jgi:outer membrane lipopolysaccharide assembly protein LptE/RlpB